MNKTNRTYTKRMTRRRKAFIAALRGVFAGVFPFLFVSALVFFTGVPGVAQEIHTDAQRQALSIVDAYLRMAAENNPELKSIEHALQARRERIPQAGALPDPEISIGYFINPDDPDTFLGRFSVSAMQMFPWYNTRQTRQDEQSALAAEQFYLLENRRNMLFAEIQTAWFDYTALELTIEIIRENRDLVADLSSIVQIRYETARAGTADLLRMQMEDRRLKTRIENLEDRKHAIRARFNELTNRHPAAPIETPNDLPPRHPAWSETELAALVKQRNPELEALSAREKAAGHRAALARLEGLPDIGIGIEVMGRDFTSMAMMPEVKEGYVGMMSIKVPLYRSSYDAKIRQALQEKHAITQSKTQAANRLSRQTEEALVNWRQSERELRLLDEELIPRAQQALSVLREEYGAGNVGFDAVLQMHRELLDLSIERVAVLTEQNKAAAEIEYLYAAGRPSEDGTPGKNTYGMPRRERQHNH